MRSPSSILVKWTKICAPLSSRGLAIGNLRRFNQAFLGKWLWRFDIERVALYEGDRGDEWACSGGSCTTNVVPCPYGVVLNLEIYKTWVGCNPHALLNSP